MRYLLFLAALLLSTASFGQTISDINDTSGINKSKTLSRMDRIMLNIRRDSIDAVKQVQANTRMDSIGNSYQVRFVAKMKQDSAALARKGDSVAAIAKVSGPTGPAGPQGSTGSAGSAGAKGDKGDPGTPKRIEPYTGTANASGVATVTFSSAFTTAPVLLPVVSWSGTTMIVGWPTAVTTTGATIQVMRSRGTLLLSAGPFEIAPSGTAASVVAMGN